MLKKMEQDIARIKQNLKATQDKEKSYANKNRVHTELNVGDHVFLKSEAKKEFFEAWKFCQCITYRW